MYLSEAGVRGSAEPVAVLAVTGMPVHGSVRVFVFSCVFVCVCVCV